MVSVFGSDFCTVYCSVRFSFMFFPPFSISDSCLLAAACKCTLRDDIAPYKHFNKFLQRSHTPKLTLPSFPHFSKKFHPADFELHSSVDAISFTPLQYDARNYVLPCWIGPTVSWSQVTELSAEIQHEEKYVDCWSYHPGRWTVNETTWKTIPKLPKSFFKPNCRNWVFGFWIFKSV